MRSHVCRHAPRRLAIVLWVPLAGLVAGCQPPQPPARPAATSAPSNNAPDSRMAGELDRAAERGNMCSSREAKAAGLTAEYFGAVGLAGKPLLTRQEGPLDADWPMVGREVATAVRSARWRGWIRPPFTGPFGFDVDLPGAQITIAGKRLTPGDDKMSLSAGRFHPIQIELRDLPASTGAATVARVPLKLNWTTPFGARYLVPKAVLFPPSDTVDGAAPKLPAAASGPAPKPHS